ncbi:unnamed protein product [Pieris macdunnoughi]|uniref:Uncharacterized protein n=1 Tax=Pieris macdunnoughi TaxID=345717 RepID=A0A821TF24_9NEOP|nr:unnamed protein product [Pieris macdunnoughi]
MAGAKARAILLVNAALSGRVNEIAQNNDVYNNHYLKNIADKYRIKKTSYNQIFVTQFNLSFGYPKSDTCATCDAGDLNDEHKSNYYAAVEAMQVDRRKPTRDGDIVYVTMDLQQTMPLPKLTTSKAFYLRQLWFYNLGIMFVMEAKKKPYLSWTEIWDREVPKLERTSKICGNRSVAKTKNTY